MGANSNMGANSIDERHFGFQRGRLIQLSRYSGELLRPERHAITPGVRSCFKDIHLQRRTACGSVTSPKGD